MTRVGPAIKLLKDLDHVDTRFCFLSYFTPMANNAILNCVLKVKVKENGKSEKKAGGLAEFINLINIPS